jgi:RNA polymerase sigma factor (sigma-70 family)
LITGAPEQCPAGASQDHAEVGIDWDRTLSLLRRILHSHLASDERQEIGDLAQEAAIRVLRAARRGPIDSTEALAGDIARKTAADFVRRKIQWRRLLERAGQEAQVPPVPCYAGAALGDPLARLRFAVLEYFSDASPGCHELARTYFSQGEDWKRVAERLAVSHAAIRRRWSRCVGRLREQIRSDPGFLGGALEEPDDD